MEPFRKILLAGFSLFVFVACEPDDPPQTNNYSEDQQLLVGTWRYDSVAIRGVYFQNADNRMIPGLNIAGMGGLRSQLDRRFINYMPNGNYQLVWDDRGDYQLGVEGTQSWQPDFGFWEYDTSLATLYHNKVMNYEQDYEVIILDDRHMARKYLRRMSQSSTDYGPSGLWVQNQLVEYFEYFTKEQKARF